MKINRRNNHIKNNGVRIKADLATLAILFSILSSLVGLRYGYKEGMEERITIENEMQYYDLERYDIDSLEELIEDIRKNIMKRENSYIDSGVRDKILDYIIYEIDEEGFNDIDYSLDKIKNIVKYKDEYINNIIMYLNEYYTNYEKVEFDKINSFYVVNPGSDIIDNREEVTYIENRDMDIDMIQERISRVRSNSELMKKIEKLASDYRFSKEILIAICAYNIDSDNTMGINFDHWDNLDGTEYVYNFNTKRDENLRDISMENPKDRDDLRFGSMILSACLRVNGNLYDALASYEIGSSNWDSMKRNNNNNSGFANQILCYLSLINKNSIETKIYSINNASSMREVYYYIRNDDVLINYYNELIELLDSYVDKFIVRNYSYNNKVK